MGHKCTRSFGARSKPTTHLTPSRQVCHEAVIEHKLKELFNFIDASGDGLIDLGELFAVSAPHARASCCGVARHDGPQSPRRRASAPPCMLSTLACATTLFGAGDEQGAAG